jgi:hypothetical protein
VIACSDGSERESERERKRVSVCVEDFIFFGSSFFGDLGCVRVCVCVCFFVFFCFGGLRVPCCRNLRVG